MNTNRPTSGTILDGLALKAAFPVTIPVLFGYIAIGIPFGLMLVKAGYPWWMAPLIHDHVPGPDNTSPSVYSPQRLPWRDGPDHAYGNVRHIVYGFR
jgi:hypothetical protein